jgi:hypothetical protein
MYYQEVELSTLPAFEQESHQMAFIHVSINPLKSVLQRLEYEFGVFPKDALCWFFHMLL